MAVDLTGIIEKSRLIEDVQSVLCAVSGGPDSMALLHAFREYAKKNDISLFAGHVNHHIRANAARDEAFVERYCRDNGIPFLSMHREVTKETALSGKTLEEAARYARYECLEEMRQRSGAQLIALAHHQDDQAETVLFRLTRGSGIKGLCGMRQKSGRLIRPFLCVSKQELLEYANFHHIPYCIDETNDDQKYTRNYLRMTVMPALSRMNPNVSGAICRMAVLAAQEDEYMDDQAAALLKKALTKAGEMNVSILTSSPLPLSRRALRLWLLRALPKDVSFDHIDAILKITTCGGQYHLPGGFRVLCSSGRMVLRHEGNDRKAEPESVRLIQNGDMRFGSAVITCSLVPGRKECAASDFVQYFDGDLFPADAVFRYRKPGDVITPLGMSDSKKLKDYLINRKIPRFYRDSIPLLCSGKNVLWVVGHGISNLIKTSEKTQRYVCVQYIKNDVGGDLDETIC